MADDFDSDTSVGLKRRLSELSEVEASQHTVEEQRSNSLSLEEPSPEIVPAAKEERGNVRTSSDFTTESFNSLLKKAKCSSSDESETNIVAQEKQETVDCELGFGNDVVTKMKGSCGGEDNGAVGLSSSQLVSKNEMDLKTYEVGFSGIQECDEVKEISSSRLSADFVVIEEKQSVKEVLMDSVVEDCSEGLPDSCIDFDENEYENFLKNQEKYSLVEPEVESIFDAKTHVVKFTDTESSGEILGDDGIKIKEVFAHTSQIGEKLGVVESKDTDLKKSGREEMQEMVQSDGLKEDGGNLICALKIEVIDETALIETASASQIGDGCGKEKGFVGFAKHPERNGNKKNLKQETDGKIEKGSRRRGKGGKKCLGTNVKEKVLTHTAEFQNGSEKKGDEAKRVYSRKRMEALRFLNLEEQRKKWIEVYCGLRPAVAREYDGLVDRNHQKLVRLNFDPRHQFGKEAPPAILGTVAAKGRGKHLKIFVH